MACCFVDELGYTSRPPGIPQQPRARPNVRHRLVPSFDVRSSQSVPIKAYTAPSESHSLPHHLAICYGTSPAASQPAARAVRTGSSWHCASRLGALHLAAWMAR